MFSTSEKYTAVHGSNKRRSKVEAQESKRPKQTAEAYFSLSVVLLSIFPSMAASAAASLGMSTAASLFLRLLCTEKTRNQKQIVREKWDVPSRTLFVLREKTQTI